MELQEIFDRVKELLKGEVKNFKKTSLEKAYKTAAHGLTCAYFTIWFTENHTYVTAFGYGIYKVEYI